MKKTGKKSIYRTTIWGDNKRIFKCDRGEINHQFSCFMLNGLELNKWKHQQKIHFIEIYASEIWTTSSFTGNQVWRPKWWYWYSLPTSGGSKTEVTTLNYCSHMAHRRRRLWIMLNQLKNLQRKPTDTSEFHLRHRSTIIVLYISNFGQ